MCLPPCGIYMTRRKTKTKYKFIQNFQKGIIIYFSNKRRKKQSRKESVNNYKKT